MNEMGVWCSGNTAPGTMPVGLPSTEGYRRRGLDRWDGKPSIALYDASYNGHGLRDGRTGGIHGFESHHTLSTTRARKAGFVNRADEIKQWKTPVGSGESEPSAGRKTLPALDSLHMRNGMPNEGLNPSIGHNNQERG